MLMATKCEGGKAAALQIWPLARRWAAFYFWTARDAALLCKRRFDAFLRVAEGNERVADVNDRYDGDNAPGYRGQCPFKW